MSGKESGGTVERIAVIGLAGRFPGAPDVETFWRNVVAGRDSIRRFGAQELLDAAIASDVVADPDYVPAAGWIEDADAFDSDFFGYGNREASLIDPQQRLLLECAWHALENAGYDPRRHAGPIGIFAGSSRNAYQQHTIWGSEAARSAGDLALELCGEKDHLTTRVSYKLGLTGPSVDVQTACSTSLVAVHLARMSLLMHECDLALAGGSSLKVPLVSGYRFERGGIASPDGRCRPFDARAAGTVRGSGVGLVVLKRLSDAERDGDLVHAVILGSAMNNDGSSKAGYTAPSVRGQAEVIAMAHAVAGVEPDSIDYVETHGTGTPMGDPIELAALTEAFRSRTDRRSFCALGSVKANIGHLDAAAGVAGLIKTVLALCNRVIPPLAHFESAHPDLGLAGSPFTLSGRAAPWPRGAGPRRAGVSSFGMGGTNVHVVLEETGDRVPPQTGAPGPQLLLWSARTPAALDRLRQALCRHAAADRPGDLADVSYTLQCGRRHFAKRDYAVASSWPEAREALAGPRAGSAIPAQPPAVAFLFPGQGSQRPGMCAELYRALLDFREELDGCLEALGRDSWRIRELLLSEAPGKREERALRDTELAQPALFAGAYSLARTLTRLGVRPDATLGHSVGEYVSACLAGVMSRDDALAVVAERGRLMSRLPRGAMLSAELPREEAEAELADALDLAASNGPSNSVFSGPVEAIDRLEHRLRERGVATQRLVTSHAFHSRMVEPAQEPFLQVMSAVPLHEPALPFVSNVSGRWITDAEATDPAYWVEHMRSRVLFGSGLGELLGRRPDIVVEVGPPSGAARLARAHPGSDGSHHPVVAALAHPRAGRSDLACLLDLLGRLWSLGVDIDWARIHALPRRRVPLPAYSFERRRCWIGHGALWTGSQARGPARRLALGDAIHVPSFRRAAAAAPAPVGRDAPLICLAGGGPTSRALLARLGAAGSRVIEVSAGAGFERRAGDRYHIDPGRPEDYRKLIESVRADREGPLRIAQIWNLDARDESAATALARSVELDLVGCVRLAQALGQAAVDDALVTLVASGIFDVLGEDSLRPEQALLLGPRAVLPQENPGHRWRCVEIAGAPPGQTPPAALLDLLAAEILGGAADPIVAVRGRHRWLPAFEPLAQDSTSTRPAFRHQGVYLVTGGLGHVGLAIAERLARTAQARLVLLGRTAPPPGEWDALCASRPASDSLRRRIERIRALEELGSEVLVVRADVSSLEQMRHVIEHIQRRFGALHGVLHAAGVVSGNSFRAARSLAPEQCESQLAAKVHGTVVLDRVLAGVDVDFVALQSSLAAVLGGIEHLAYSAANAFMDAFARERASRGLPWISIDWEGWAFPERHSADARGLGSEQARLDLAPDDGFEILERILGSSLHGQVAVSMAPLAERMERWLDPTRLEAASAPAPSELVHVRPDSPALATDTERALAAIWQALLGAERIDRRDDFFALGGHSLLGIRLAARLWEVFEVDVPLKELFRSPGLADMAELLERKLLDRLEAMTEVEAQECASRNDEEPR